MAKRTADTQLTKDGPMSDEDGTSVGSQIVEAPRATAAQMANRRLAKPRGGRRPGTPGHSRPIPQPTASFGSTQPSPFQSSNPNGINGIQQQQNPFSFLNGSSANQVNPISQSFPPFGDSNNGFNTQFTAPSSSGFNFSASQSDSINNPFTTQYTSSNQGFQGNIFNLPSQQEPQQPSQQAIEPPARDREGEQAPMFAARSPFQNQNQDPISSPSQTPNNPFAIAVNQQQPSATGSSIFSQPQQQTANNIFASQQPGKTTTDLFAHLKKPQSEPQVKTSDNPLGQSNSIFQQPQNTQQPPNFFQHLGSSQPSTPFDQTSTSTAQEDQSMMSTSPDTSPSSRPFSFLNGSNDQPQTSPTKVNTAPAAGGSLFDRISKQTPDSNTQAPSGSAEGSAKAGEGSIFSRISKPTPEKNIFGQPNAADQATSQGGNLNIFGGISKPASETSSQPFSAPENSSPFKFQQTSTASSIFSAPSGDSQPAKKKLFGQSLPQPAAQSSSGAHKSLYPSLNGHDVSQPQNEETYGTSGSSHSAGDKVQAMPGNKRKFDAGPDSVEDFTEGENVQLSRGYRLRQFDIWMRKRIRAAAPQSELALLKQFYHERIETIRQAKEGPNETLEVGIKRKAAEEQHEGKGQGKKARTGASLQDSQGIMSNGTGSTSSQTSSLFKNILGNKGQETTKNDMTGAGPPPVSTNIFQSSSLSSSNGASTSSMFQPPSQLTSSTTRQQPSSTSSSNLFIPKNPDAAPATASLPPSSIFQPSGTTTASTLGSSSPSNFNPANNHAVPSDETRAPISQIPTFAANTPSSSNTLNLFNAKPTTSSEAPSQSTKASPAPKAPIFGSIASSASASSSLLFENQTTTSGALSDAPKVPAFKVPTFGGGSTQNFMAQFSRSAEKTAEEVKNKRKADEYDSDEEDEATWEQKYAEEQQAKKQKLDEAIKTRSTRIVDGKLEWVDTHEDALKESLVPGPKPTIPSASIFNQSNKPLTNGQNTFEHLKSGHKDGDNKEEDADEDEESEGEDKEEEGGSKANNEEEEGLFLPANGESRHHELSVTDQQNGQGPVDCSSSQPVDAQRDAPSLSIFDRISKDDKGNPIRAISKPDASQASSPFIQESAGNTNLSISSGFSAINSFGRPNIKDSTSNGDTSSSVFGKNTFGKITSSTPTQNDSGKPSYSEPPSDAVKTGESPTGDHTWKPDSPIRFGGNPPVVNVTSPSPSKSPFTGLFGASKTNTTIESPSKPTSIFASTTPTKAAPTNLGFNFTPAKPAANSLTAPPAPGSGVSSRATSPGATTGESANESSAENDDAHAPQEAQLDLVSGGPGEENEDALFSVKAKAMVYDTQKKQWITKGLGPLRVLKHRETSATRILMRQDPNGRVVMNASLLKDLKYENPQEKIIRVPIVEASGKVASWMLKVGKDEDAKKLTNILSENQPS